ncbi:MAG TPA: T9SS type A sorting domain-containing protein, partial [Ignavibacteria bacterium]|nr:T9SS type A sorting domain-containing protein [Ignavibacteria bacterium]
NIYVTGLSGDSRYLTVKYNSAGVQQWYNHYSGPGEDPASIAAAIAVDTYGNSFITGMHFEVSTVQAAFYTTLKYTSSGGDNFTTLFNNNGNLNKPETFSLSQNYPNPFNPVTNIIYSIPVNGLVCLTVYNMLGQEVTKLVNENKHAGSYNVTFDGTNLSSGIYFYDITAGDYMERKKMVLLK